MDEDRKKRRKNIGLSQAEAALAAGVSLATWRRWESGKHRVSAESDEACNQIFFAETRSKTIEDEWELREKNWTDCPFLTPRQAFAISSVLSLWADLYLTEWLTGSPEPLHEIAPFNQLDLRIMILVNDNKAWVAKALERCEAVVAEIDKGILPFDRPGCFFDELLIALSLSEASERSVEMPELFEGIAARDATGSNGVVNEDDWAAVFDSFNQQSRWDIRFSPPFSHRLLFYQSLQSKHPFTWFDENPLMWLSQVSQLMEDAPEISENEIPNDSGMFDQSEPCPCGSGKEHGRCCIHKKFIFSRDNESNVSRRVPVPKALNSIIDDTFNDYQQLYGREPVKDDLMFAFHFNPAESTNYAVPFLRELGLPEDEIYAYCKTDGLLLTGANRSLRPESDWREYEEFRREYKALIAQDVSMGNAPSALWYVQTTNKVIGTALQSANEYLRKVLNDFLSRNHDSDFSDFTVTTPLEYCVFSAFKTLKTLNSIQRLTDYSMPEAIYALARGIFENYLYLKAIANDENFFWQKIRPKSDSQNYEFAVKNGKTDYSKLIHKRSGTKADVEVPL